MEATSLAGKWGDVQLDSGTVYGRVKIVAVISYDTNVFLVIEPPREEIWIPFHRIVQIRIP